jgi:hypothetical protein
VRRALLFCVGGLLAVIANVAFSAPVVSGITTSSDANGQAAITVTMPATIAANDLIVVLICALTHESTVTPNGSWTLLSTQSNTRNVALWLNAVGNEDGTSVAVATMNSTAVSANAAFIVTGHADPAVSPPVSSTKANDAGASTTPDPPSFSPTYGSREYLWIAWACVDQDPTTSAYPTGYADNQTRYTYTSANFETTTFATKVATATSDDPSTFTMSESQFWSARTLAIPSASSVTILNPPRRTQ